MPELNYVGSLGLRVHNYLEFKIRNRVQLMHIHRGVINHQDWVVRRGPAPSKLHPSSPATRTLCKCCHLSPHIINAFKLF